MSSILDEGENRFDFASSFTENGRNDFGVYAKGYRNAAITIAESLMNESRFQDYKAYPVVFLYRHAFELSLKNIIYSLPTLIALRQGGKIDDRLHNDHKLEPLATLVQKLLSIVFHGDDNIDSLCGRISVTAKDFALIDSNSFSFRYPIDREGKPSTVHHLALNLKSVCRHMNGILDDIEVLDFGIGIETTNAMQIRDIMESVWPRNATD